MHKKTFASAFALAWLLLFAITARAGYIPMETIQSAAQKSDILVVGQITKIETLSHEISPQWKIPVVNLRATIKIFRGIRSRDLAPLPDQQLTIDYQNVDPTQPVVLTGRPMFPGFAEGHVYLVPLRRVEGIPNTPDTCQFVDEDGFGLVHLATQQPLNDDAPASPADFMNRELVNNFVHGKFFTLHSTYQFLRDACWTNPEIVAPILNLLQSQSLNDARWVDIAASAYAQQGTPRDSLAALLAEENPPFTATLLLQLACAKANPKDLDSRLLHSLIAHQVDSFSNAIPDTLAHYLHDPQFVAEESAALANPEPGALDVINSFLHDKTSPIVQPVIVAARKRLTLPVPEESRDVAAALSLILRLGSDEDFSYLLTQISRAKTQSPASLPQFLPSTLEPPARVIAVARLLIDDQTPGRQSVFYKFKDLRLCDYAADLIQEVAQQDFAFHLDTPIAIRNQSIQRLRSWLTAHP